jgi:hypothetical protein
MILKIQFGKIDNMLKLRKSVIKELPKELTSYDFLKAFAILMLILDHIGYYFFPDQIEWRLAGRVGIPAWMFLIGYAHARDIRFILLGGSVLLLSNLALGLTVFPLDILFTIAIIRLSLDFIGFCIQKNTIYLFVILILSSIVIDPTYHYFEYGTSALLYAIFGYVIRHQDRLELSNYTVYATTAIAIAANTAIQVILKSLNVFETSVVIISTVIVCYVLINFKSKVYPELTERFPKFLVWILQCSGRKTLEIYIGLMLFFKIGRMVINSY